MHFNPFRRGQACALALAVFSPLVWSQTAGLPNAMLGWRGVEVYSGQSQLNAGYEDWRETGVRGIYQSNAHQIAAEAVAMHRFGESGHYVAVGDTVVLDPQWYASLALGAGDGAAYLPQYRVDAFLHRKMLRKQNLVASLGMGHYKAPDVHRDDNFSLGATYYFEQPWIVQGEMRQTRSQPGDVRTLQYFVAATWGMHRQTRITGRYGWGEEGYQSLGSANGFIFRFPSHQSSLTVQHWIGQHWGIKAGAEDYRNPYYRRTGLRLALFRDFP